MNRIIRFSWFSPTPPGFFLSSFLCYGLPDVDSTGVADQQRRCWWDAPDSEDRKSSWRKPTEEKRCWNRYHDSRGKMEFLTPVAVCWPSQKSWSTWFCWWFFGLQIHWISNPLNIMKNAPSVWEFRTFTFATFLRFLYWIQILRLSGRFPDHPTYYFRTTKYEYYFHTTKPWASDIDQNQY